MSGIIWTLIAAALFRLAECIVKVKSKGKITIAAIIAEFLTLS